MRSGNISKTLFLVILLVFLINAIVSTANVIEDGVLLRRTLPAACWIGATIIWIILYFRKSKGEN